MAAVDVLGCVIAVTSAFRTGADIVHAVRGRSERKKKRREKDMEQAFEEKMLQKALAEGESRCQTFCSECREHFGRAFEVGDALATSALKDIMVSLQTEVITALQIARAVDNVELDLSRLYEATITNKNNTIRVMEELCLRLAASAPVELPGSSNYTFPDPLATTIRMEMQKRRYLPKGPSELYGSAPSTPGIHSAPIPGLVYYQPPPSNFPRTQLAPYTSTIEPDQNLLATGTVRSNSAMSIRTLERKHTPVQQETMEQQTDATLDSIRKLALSERNDSALGSVYTSSHRPSASLSSTLTWDENEQSYSTAFAINQHPDYRHHLAYSERARSPTLESTSDCRSECSTLSAPSLQQEREQGVLRAVHTPRAVNKEFGSTLTHKPARMGAHTYTPRPLEMNNIHPIYRDQYMESPGAVDAEPDMIWSPLARPAKLNDYHGFCKGAWDTRSSWEDGLAITYISSFRVQNAPHWKCRQCVFRSKPVSNLTSAPDQILSTGCGIRYRWVFLSKSHISAKKASNKPETYAYGCIFCTAQGNKTAIHDGLNSLMGHIIFKHKTPTLTPEVLERTRCAVGGAPDRSDQWDIHIPASRLRVVSDDEPAKRRTTFGALSKVTAFY